VLYNGTMLLCVIKAHGHGGYIVVDSKHIIFLLGGCSSN
jgi:hypothetical protein